MKIKSIIFTAVLATAVLCSPFIASAASLTSSQISAIMNLLYAFGADSATIANVQTSLTGGTPNILSNSWCHTFNANLGVGNAGNEIAALHAALTKEGFTSTSWRADNFTETTASAVVQFQQKYGISRTGYVGPLTRAKLNALYGCRIITPQNITINSVSGPNSLNVGQTGTWTVNATAPSGTNLTYRAAWGEYDGYMGISSQAIPTGLINQTGTFTHSYANAGTYTATFIVYSGYNCVNYSTGALNSACSSTQTSLTVVVGAVNGNLSITYPSDPANWHDYVGGNYSKVFSVVNSSASRHYSWSITSGSLPSGLNLTNQLVACATYACVVGQYCPPCPDGSSQIIITGTPTQAGNFPFTLTVRDDLGNTGLVNLNIYIETMSGCANLYWADNTNRSCQTMRQFCGAYMYYGLYTFNTQQDCINAVTSGH
ncbi:MAG: peptidoglycan-binding domain-containing protein [Candidatus Staskawiczbacteria bacterium]|nr:peptidoglycan-binding domain-containing protein [Candidatus Staskawiczbacteria bacterium]